MQYSQNHQQTFKVHLLAAGSGEPNSWAESNWIPCWYGGGGPAGAYPWLYVGVGLKAGVGDGAPIADTSLTRFALRGPPAGPTIEGIK